MAARTGGTEEKIRTVAVDRLVLVRMLFAAELRMNALISTLKGMCGTTLYIAMDNYTHTLLF